MANKPVTLALHNESPRKQLTTRLTIFPTHSHSMHIREIEGMNGTATEPGLQFENEARREQCGGEEARKKPALSD